MLAAASFRRRPTAPRSTDLTLPAGLLLGSVLDAAIGDPRKGHPVAAFGVVAGALERRLWRDSRAAGMGYALTCTAVPVAGAVALSRAGMRDDEASWRGPLHWWLRTGWVAAATWSVLGGTTLAAEARAIAGCLAAGDLEAARRRLPSLVGRDPSALDELDVARAVVESVAENTSDAVVAPLLWGAVLGSPGLLGYRAINTLDAMVGYRSTRYERFGWAAARTDDVANWVPARLTGWLVVMLAPLVGGSACRAGRVLVRDGARHPSPNAGRCEAAFAGALGVRLGGRNDYAGRVEERPVLGAEGRIVGDDGHADADVDRAVRLSLLVGRVAVVLAVVASAGRARRLASRALDARASR